MIRGKQDKEKALHISYHLDGADFDFYHGSFESKEPLMDVSTDYEVVRKKLRAKFTKNVNTEKEVKRSGDWKIAR